MVNRGGIEMSQKIAVIKVKLLDTKLSIWRRIEVPFDITLYQLHDIIQESMGWFNFHLHEFYVKKLDISYSLPVEGNEDTIDTRKTMLETLWSQATQCVYTYDMGDGWRHEIKFERIIPAKEGVFYPRCIKGEGQCPPEDVGGVWGYEELLEIIKHPTKEQEKDEDLREIFGILDGEKLASYDPSFFDMEDTNARLVSLDEDFRSEYETYADVYAKR